MSDFVFVQRHNALERPEYLCEIDEYRRPDGAQFLLAHIRVDKFNKAVLRRIDHEWRVFRTCVRSPLFAIAETDDEKWERFISRLGFRFLRDVICENGSPRRLFISVPQDNHERLPKDHPNTVPKLANEPLGTTG